MTDPKKKKVIAPSKIKSKIVLNLKEKRQLKLLNKLKKTKTELTHCLSVIKEENVKQVMFLK